MAAPNAKSLRDLSGTWKMNGEASDDIDGVLQIQGFNTILRKAIKYAPVKLQVTQTQDGSNTKYRIDQTTTANIPAVNEEWFTDWSFRETKDPVMGLVKAKARWIEPSAADDEFLLSGWIDEGPQQIQAYVESVGDGWTANQVWGFEQREGNRMFVRRVVVKKDQQVEKVSLVYDFEKE